MCLYKFQKVNFRLFMTKHNNFDPDKVTQQRNFEIFTLVARISFVVQLVIAIATTAGSSGANAIPDGGPFSAIGGSILNASIWTVGFVIWWISLVLSIIANNISAQTKSPGRGLAITSMVLAITSIIPIISILFHVPGIIVSGILISKLNGSLAEGSSHVDEVQAKESKKEEKEEEKEDKKDVAK